MADISLHVTGPVVDLLRELEVVRRERDALRIIASDHLAGSNVTVKPEDADDVAKWAANPDAVRELLKHTPHIFGRDGDAACGACDVRDGISHRPRCSIAAAWRALGDPRGAADIERAHEEALRENRRVRASNVTVTVDGRALDGRALTFESQQTRMARTWQARTHYPDGAPRMTPCDCAACEGELARSRSTSDARGMDAVEAEADDENDRRAYPKVHGPPRLSDVPMP